MKVRFKVLASSLMLGATLMAAAFAAPRVDNRVASVPAAMKPMDHEPARPECPQSGMWTHHFSDRYDLKRPGKTPTAEIALDGQLYAPDIITDIPEFHDCQQFIAEDKAGPRFISLFAIFASINLAKTITDSTVANFPFGRIAAEIYAYDSAYSPLAIGPHFNCLFLKRIHSGEFEAYLFPVGRAEASCRNPNPQLAVKLAVNRVKMPGSFPDDYPPVARWDFDTASKHQFVGIRCGDAWCEVRSPGDIYTPNPPANKTIAVGKQRLTRRVLEVKGWHDQQRLAVMKNGKLVVGTMVGTFIPAPDLGNDHDTNPAESRFSKKWVKVATIALSESSREYVKKLSIVKSDIANAKTVISLCYSPPLVANKKQVINTNLCSGITEQSKPICHSKDTGQWWQKTESPGNRTVYRCVIRRAHDNLPIKVPGIVRWRWMLDDDTEWIRCLDGCCEVESTKM